MRHLKIKIKLLLSFAMVSMLAVVVGVVGTAGLSSTDARYHDMLDRNMTAISAVSDIRESFMQQRLALRTMLVDFNDPVKLQTDIANLKAAESVMENAMALYERIIVDQNNEKDYYTAKDIYLNEYLAIKTEMTGAINARDYEATLTAMGKGGTCGAVITGNLQKLVASTQEKVENDSAVLSAASDRTNMIQIIVMILSVALAMTLGIYISLIISTPMKIMSEFFVKFGATGDLSLSEDDKKNIAIAGENRDETGQCIKAAAQMVGRLAQVNDSLAKVADSDLTVEIEALSEKDSMGLAVIKMVENLGDMFGELRAASGQVSTGAGQIAQGAQELASGSSQQAVSVEGFSRSLEGLQEKTAKNAESSKNAAKLNEKMGLMINESVVSMENMLEAMKGIDESSKNITRVIKVIDDIAFQTNILALNAAVEAARAGQHGKGFAVVADEVRNLASKSADAAKETALLIEGSSEKVREGNQIVEKTNSSLEAVAETSKQLVRIIEEVSGASAEQASSIKEINRDIEQISSVVQENSASAEESAAAAEEMSTQAAALDGITARFKLKKAAEPHT